MIMAVWSSGQEREWITMQEDQAGVYEGQEADGEMEHLDFWRRRKLSLNEVLVDELMMFPFVTAYQAEQLILYRRLLGNLIDVLELQAVPGWDEVTIRRILPYVSIVEKEQFKKQLKKSLTKGSSQFIWRGSLKKGAGLLARYQFRSSHFQFGVQVEKDAGEKIWLPKKGFEFLSGQLAVQKIGVVRQFIVGDFSVSMGQGLLLGMGRAVRKSGMPMMVKRQQAFLMPYRSTDENRFLRGVGMWLARGNWEVGGFYSVNHLDGNLMEDSIRGRYVSSLQTSGIHISPAELLDRNSLRHRAIGLMGAVQIGKWRVGIHGVDHAFGLPIIRSNYLYNIYSINGKRDAGVGMKLESSVRNLHVFGEAVRNREGNMAYLVGALLAVDRKLDFSLVVRNMAKAYKTFWGSSFTEVTEPGDEKGVYMGLSFRPAAGIQLEGYIDLYHSDWLKYQINAPTIGFDQLFICQVKPDKVTTIYYRYHREMKTDGVSLGQGVSAIGERISTGGRLHTERKLSDNWIWRSRVEWVKQQTVLGSISRGALVYTEWFWKNIEHPFSFNGRIMICETDDYASRLYAYENDVFYYGLIPSYYGRFVRIYGNVNVKLNKHWMMQGKASLRVPIGLKEGLFRVQMVWRN